MMFRISASLGAGLRCPVSTVFPAAALLVQILGQTFLDCHRQRDLSRPRRLPHFLVLVFLSALFRYAKLSTVIKFYYLCEETTPVSEKGNSSMWLVGRFFLGVSFCCWFLACAICHWVVFARLAILACFVLFWVGFSALL